MRSAVPCRQDFTAWTTGHHSTVGADDVDRVPVGQRGAVGA